MDYKDIYTLPFDYDIHSGWVRDRKRQFAFQFELGDIEKEKLLTDVINGDKLLENKD